MRKIWIAFLMMAACLFAQGGEKNCKEVGGAVLTNFLPTPEQGTKGTTLGTATGDLRGGLGVDALSINPGPNGTTVYHVQHHWVTETGDTIFLKDAELTTFPPQHQWLSCIEIYRWRHHYGWNRALCWS